MENYKFIQNKNCEYFPCHKLKEGEAFNCLFCYCPLYALKDKCGGNFTYTKSSVKSCVNCTKPHDANGYEHIQNHIKEILELGKKKEEKE